MNTIVEYVKERWCPRVREHTAVIAYGVLIIGVIGLLFSSMPIGVEASTITVAGTETVIQSSTPTVSVQNATINTSETIWVPIMLSRAPNGLAGYELTVKIETPAVATIRDASYPDRFALTSDPEFGDNNASVRLQAADLENKTKPGATQIQLARIKVKGMTRGETRLSLEEIQMDDDAGNSIDPSTSRGELSVRNSTETASTPSPSSTSTSTSTPNPTSTSTTTAPPVRTTDQDQRDGGVTDSPPTTPLTRSSPASRSSPSHQSPTGTPLSVSLMTTSMPTPMVVTTTSLTSTVTGTGPGISTSPPLSRKIETTTTPGQSGFGVLVTLVTLLMVLAARRTDQLR